MILSLLLAALFSSGVAAETPTDVTDEQLAERGEAAFQAGLKLREKGEHGRAEFRTAAGAYEEMRSRGIQNADFYYNIGNSYFLADDLPHAILCYRRGLSLSPWDPTLNRCLAEAREQVVYPDNNALGRPASLSGSPWLPAWLIHTILAVAVLLYALACVAGIRLQMTHSRLLLWCALGGVALAAVLVLPLASEGRRLQEETLHPLVVVSKDGVLLRKGDGTAFPVRYDTPINRGVEARLLFERAGWVQIELGSGEIGWVASDAVLTDRP
jgi:hypothetical protein